MLKPLVTFALFVAAFAVKPSGLTNKLRGGRGECPPEARDLIAECEAGAARPSFGADGCPSCRRPSAWRTCTRMVKKACPAPATCADDQEPELADCCISCKPAKAVCTEETKMACKAAMETLPVCVRDSKKFFNAANCCPTCKREPRRNKNKECDQGEFKTCSKAARQCEANEDPMMEEGQCCMTCRRRGRDTPARDMAKCAGVPECTADEEPIKAQDDSGGFVCPTCRKGKPTCEPACDEGKGKGKGKGKGEVCVRSRETDAKGKCLPKKRRRFKLRAQKAVDKAFLKNATAAEVEELLAEIVQRFCDKPKNEKICKFKTTLLDGLKVEITKVDDVEVEVEVKVAEGSTVASNEVEGGGEGRRMLLSADDMTDLLNDALADVEATEGFAATVADSDASSAQSSAQSVVASAALVSALAVLIL